MPNISSNNEIDFTRPVKFFATSVNKDGGECLHEDTVVKFKDYNDMKDNAGLYALCFQVNRPLLRYWWVYEDEEIKEGTTRIELRFNFQGE